MTDVLLIVFIALSISFAASFLLTFYQLKKTSEAFAKLVVITDFLNNASNPKQDKDDLTTHQENFIKFLSDSRDWAFGYIEEVQDSIKKFIDVVSPDIEYFDEYGNAGPMGPDHEALKRISKAFKELKTLLPEEEEK